MDLYYWPNIDDEYTLIGLSRKGYVFLCLHFFSLSISGLELYYYQCYYYKKHVSIMLILSRQLIEHPYPRMKHSWLKQYLNIFQRLSPIIVSECQ